MGVQSVSDYRNPRARLALPSVPGSTYSTQSSAVSRQDGTAGPQSVVLVVKLVGHHSCGAKRLPVAVRFPAGPRVRFQGQTAST